MVGGNRPRHLASQPQIFHGYCQINHDLSAVWGIARINDATFGIEAAFVFLWEVYSREYPPRLCLRDEALAEIDEFPTTRQSLSPFAQFLAFLISSRESNEFRNTTLFQMVEKERVHVRVYQCRKANSTVIVPSFRRDRREERVVIDCKDIEGRSRECK